MNTTERFLKSNVSRKKESVIKTIFYNLTGVFSLLYVLANTIIGYPFLLAASFLKLIPIRQLQKICTKILGVKSAKELACVIAAVGLAQNFSAIRALASEGIQKGHMKLHARNIAASAGVKTDKIDEVTRRMIKEGNISVHRAKEILKEL
mgnify:CR=1 FL=1